jgi:hypothetical protein
VQMARFLVEAHVLGGQPVGELAAAHGVHRNRGQGQIIGAVSIHERPAEAEDRAIPGHREGDLISGTANSYLATLSLIVPAKGFFAFGFNLSDRYHSR